MHRLRPWHRYAIVDHDNIITANAISIYCIGSDVVNSDVTDGITRPINKTAFTADPIKFGSNFSVTMY